MMKHHIGTIKNRLVVGMKTKASVLTISETTKQLAQLFMPRRHEVTSRIGQHVFSIQNYGQDYNPSEVHSEFEKWVGVEVENFNIVPESMDSIVIPSGTYAVFHFKGSVSEFPKSRAYIFQEWLPNSEYQLDQKVHFEILSENYSTDFQNIEEDIWIPVKKK
ncbi:GyrI-like domain-containing protein [Psychroserpens mesophilus]|uniref:GyrI-like domain-containing protein n=1 Tax=Psychroserpens mesophilus TaxID=325473 RepID=UPI003D650674